MAKRDYGILIELLPYAVGLGAILYYRHKISKMAEEKFPQLPTPVVAPEASEHDYVALADPRSHWTKEDYEREQRQLEEWIKMHGQAPVATTGQEYFRPIVLDLPGLFQG